LGRRGRGVSLRETLLREKQDLEFQLSIVNQALKKLDGRSGNPDTAHELQANGPAHARGRRIKGVVSLPEAAEDILKQADGPVLVSEIYRKALAMGFVTDASDPLLYVSIGLSKLKKKGWPIERVGERQWQWLNEAKQEMQP
jgi:hypothetical protein